MKTAILHVETFTIGCPWCGECIDDPRYGTTVWEPCQVAQLEELECRNCKTKVRLPKTARLERR